MSISLCCDLAIQARQITIGSPRPSRARLVAHLLERTLGALREPDHAREDQNEDRRHRVEVVGGKHHRLGVDRRSEEHTSELQSLMRISYAVFCLKKKTK